MNEAKEIKLPLADFYHQQNFLATPVNGKSAIPFFNSAEEEYNSIIHGVAYYDRSCSTLIELTGKEVLDFLNRITTNECLSIPKNFSTRTIFTTEKGRMLDSVLVMNLGDNQYLFGNKGTNAKLLRWIQRYIIMDDVRSVDLTGRMGVFEIFGPQAESFLILLFGDTVDSIEMNEVKRVEFEEVSLFLCRTQNFCGEEIFIIFGEFPSIQNALLYSRLNKSVFNFNLVGEDAYDAYRIEKQIPNENELNDNFNPHEALLKNQISFTKGCYIGQEVIARLDTYDKVQRTLVGFEFDAKPPVNSFTIKDENGAEAAQITSVGFSFAAARCIGLGYVKKNLENSPSLKTNVEGTELSLSIKPSEKKNNVAENLY